MAIEQHPAFERHTGLHDAAGKRMRELEPRHEEHWFETYGRIDLTGEPERFQNAAEHLGGRVFDVYVFRIGAPEERKVAILFTDITRRREVEEERLRLRGLEASVRSEAAERQSVAEPKLQPGRVEAARAARVSRPQVGDGRTTAIVLGREVGCAEVFTKPVNVEELRTSLRGFAEGRLAGTPPVVELPGDGC